MNSLEAIRYSHGKLELLNQLLLPLQFKYEDCSSCELTFHAIRNMKVRGAPAIAIASALALACELKKENFNSQEELKNYVNTKLNFLCDSRPTAVNLFKMAEEVKSLCTNKEQINLNELKEKIIYFAEKMFSDDVQTNKLIGKHGSKIILEQSKTQSNLNILTHCNTGSLATAGFGTALGVIRSLREQNKLEHAYCTETRPYNQGARLTAFELVYDKIPATLIADSMVSFLMKTKKVHAVVVGADRIACNGDTANKIGTYQLAIAAAYHGIPFYVAAPTTTIDFNIKSGVEIHIEERPAHEMTHFKTIEHNIQIAASGIEVWNPSFDVTPACLITGIITEKSVFKKTEKNEFTLCNN